MSVRLWFNLMPSFAMQVSTGMLASPEQLQSNVAVPRACARDCNNAWGFQSRQLRPCGLRAGACLDPAGTPRTALKALAPSATR